MDTFDIGIEFEYLMVDLAGYAPLRIRDFSNLDYADLAGMISEKPGLDDDDLATGDLGIKSGYWYVEGDERFHDDGRFRTMAVKGMEIRTPPLPGPEQAVSRLQVIEQQLSDQLAGYGIGLAIAGFNPGHAQYAFDPPLNAWEQELRARHRSYDGSHISTLSYGPDINLSFPGWHLAKGLEAARKLNAIAPYIVPFSFSSPFYFNSVWPGLSKRTYERAALRPAVKYFVDAELVERIAKGDPLVLPARISREIGRIEFKAFDAFLDPELLRSACYLLAGVCMSPRLPTRADGANLELYRRAALYGFADEEIERGARQVLDAAVSALGRRDAQWLLSPLFALLESRRTPAHALLEHHRYTGLKFKLGGLADVEVAHV